MKKNTKIIQISGIKGILTTIFIVTCLAAGFIAFPGYVAMNIWNHFAENILPEINLYQGVLLWAIVSITYFIINKQSFAVSLCAPKELSEDEMNVLMERIRMQSRAKMINKMIMKKVEETKDEQHLENKELSEKETINK